MKLPEFIRFNIVITVIDLVSKIAYFISTYTIISVRAIRQRL